MNTDTAAQLLKKYTEGECSSEEELLVNRWYMEEAAKNESRDPAHPIAEYDLIWKGIQDQLNFKNLEKAPAKSARIIPLKWLIAASMFLVASFVLIYLVSSGNKHEAMMAEIRKNDIAPGGNNATLTFSDGKKIELSDSKNGIIIDASDMTYDDGSSITSSLRGTKQSQQDSEDERSMTVSTPRGGQYQIKLPDGTKVWMNAASSIKFPARFSGAERRISLAGEAYFEVSKNEAQPFIVMTGQQEITVLGTHFNINAYSDEPAARTTLLEGAVRVSSSQSTSSSLRGAKQSDNAIVLKPGQQAVMTAGSIKVSKANLEEAISWKNGKFRFSNESIESLMRKVSRWYNVKVEYRGEIPKERFGGQVSKFNKVSDILEVLQLTGFVHFKIEGPDENGAERRIVVLP
jgi:transmembrane sensor